MERPSEKLSKAMSYEELSIESEWHLAEASKYLEAAEELRAEALDMNENAAGEVLQLAIEKDAEAEAHIHHSNLLNSIMYGRLPEPDAARAQSAAKG